MQKEKKKCYNRKYAFTKVDAYIFYILKETK